MNELTTQAAQLVKGKCQCGTALETPFPPMVLFNNPISSALVIPHVEGITCPACGMYHALGIAGTQVTMVLMPAQKPEEAPRILPATGLRIVQ